LKLTYYIFNASGAFIVGRIIGDNNLMFDIDLAKVAIDSEKQPAERFAPIIGGIYDAEIHSGRVIAESGPTEVYKAGILTQRDSKQPLGSTLLSLPLCALPSIALLPVCNNDTPAAVQFALAPALFVLAGNPRSTYQLREYFPQVFVLGCGQYYLRACVNKKRLCPNRQRGRP
jgi:hypothetical protein